MNLEKIIAIRNAKTIYKDGDNCVKVFNNNYLKSDILNEALNHARAEELPINVPKIKEIGTIEGKWAIISEFIKGDTLAQLMEKYPEKKDEYLKRFVEIQKILEDYFTYATPASISRASSALIKDKRREFQKASS